MICLFPQATRPNLDNCMAPGNPLSIISLLSGLPLVQRIPRLPRQTNTDFLIHAGYKSNFTPKTTCKFLTAGFFLQRLPRLLHHPPKLPVLFKQRRQSTT